MNKPLLFGLTGNRPNSLGRRTMGPINVVTGTGFTQRLYIDGEKSSAVGSNK